MTEWANRITGEGEENPEQLVANPDNWRVHPNLQQEVLGDVLDEVGWVQRVIVNKTTGHMVDGHLRAQLATSRGERSIPVTYVELTVEEERKILATLDPLAAMSATDETKRQELLAQVSAEGEALSAWLAEMLPSPPLRGDPDEIPDVPAKPITKPGDLWRLGEHRLLCGDATDQGDVTRLLGDANVSLVATDPPYGVGYSGVVAARKNQKRGGWKELANDEVGEQGAEITGQALKLVREHAADGCAVLVWHPPGDNAQAFRAALVEAGVHILKQIVWVKPTLVFGRHEYHWRHENAMYGWFEGSRANFYGDRSETTVWEIAPSPEFAVRNGPAMASGGLGLAPTQKPVELSARAIRNHTRGGEATYEPFGGSGSALVAAEEEGRKCFAMEIDPAYCDVIVARWEGLTGKKAKRSRT